jgi:hypothetical protein
MSFVMSPKDGGGFGSATSESAETVACVFAICLLASAPLLLSIALMIWGG